MIINPIKLAEFLYGNNIMLDLESMGTGSNAAIVAIGAAKFSGEGVTDTFYKIISLSSSLSAGMEVDASTIMWWLGQSAAARRELLKTRTLTLTDALIAFSLWVGEEPIIWGNGAAFDNVVLSNAYSLCDIIKPWKFWNDRCYRTVKNMFPEVEMDKEGTVHNALHDAVNQANHLIKIANTSF